MNLVTGGDLLRGFDAFRHRREAQRLRRFAKGEPVLAAASGRDLKREGVLAVTPSRILWVTPWTRRTFDLGRLQGIRVATDRDQGIVTLEEPGLELAVARIRPDDAKRFAAAVKQAARDAGNRAIATRAVDDHPDHPDARPELGGETARARLDRLERMLERGSITYPEYLANRRRILDRSPPPPEPPRGTWWRRF